MPSSEPELPTDPRELTWLVLSVLDHQASLALSLLRASERARRRYHHALRRRAEARAALIVRAPDGTWAYVPGRDPRRLVHQRACRHAQATGLAALTAQDVADAAVLELEDMHAAMAHLVRPHAHEPASWWQSEPPQSLPTDE